MAVRRADEVGAQESGLEGATAERKRRKTRRVRWGIRGRCVPGFIRGRRAPRGGVDASFWAGRWTAGFDGGAGRSDGESASRFRFALEVVMGEAYRGRWREVSGTGRERGRSLRWLRMPARAEAVSLSF